MASRRLSERTRLALLAAEEARRRAKRRLYRSPLVRWRYGGPSVEQLLILPQDLRTGDPSFADEVASGSFGLAGALAIINDASPFAVRAPSRGWEIALHGFGWLRDLRAASDDAEVRELARDLVLDWIARCKVFDGIAWEPAVTARRVQAWIANGALLLENADDAGYDVMMQSLDRQMRFLAACYRDIPPGEARLTTLAALLTAGLCVADQQKLVDRHLEAFAQELRAQILPDGGHVTRNSAVLIELLLDLLPLKQCFLARQRTAPVALAEAIRRMIPMLRYMRLGDGTIAHFNGVGATAAHDLATVLAYEEQPAVPLAAAPDTGYLRIERHASKLLLDVGPPPILQLSGDAHAGCLSFELSSGPCGMIVNCGAPGAAHQDLRTVARSTAAHSTLSVGDVSSARLIESALIERHYGAQPISGPRNVTQQVANHDGVIEAVMSHDGYLPRLGLRHTRSLRMETQGLQIAGRDRLTVIQGSRLPLSGVPFAVRFHLHPEVEARKGEEPDTVELTLGNGETWQMIARGAKPGLEDSTFYADASGPRQSLQIVLRGLCADEISVDWSLARTRAGGR